MPPATQKSSKEGGNGEEGTETKATGGSSWWWVKYLVIGLLVVSLIGVGFYCYKLKGQLDACNKEKAAICANLDKVTVDLAKCCAQLEELTKKTTVQDAMIEKTKMKNKELKTRFMASQSPGNFQRGGDGCEGGTCKIPSRGDIGGKRGMDTTIIRE